MKFNPLSHITSYLKFERIGPRFWLGFRNQNIYFPFLQETCEGKVTQLYSGFGYEQIVKMAWTSLLLQPMVIWRPWHVQPRFFTRELVAERELPRVHQKVWGKVPPIHPKKKTDFGRWDPDTCTPIGCRKGTLSERLFIILSLLWTSLGYPALPRWNLKHKKCIWFGLKSIWETHSLFQVIS